jgi:hypothetical protein
MTHSLTPRSLVGTPCDFSLWGCVKDQVYHPAMPQYLRELRGRILQAIANVCELQLWRTREEFEYRVVVCRVTDADHTEHP